MLVSVGADQDVDTGGGPGCDPIDRTCGKDVAVNDWLPGHQADRHFMTPAPWGGLRVEISVQGCLSLEQAIHGHCRDRLPGGHDAQSCRELLADAYRGGG
jgi:hypothetical protein